MAKSCGICGGNIRKVEAPHFNVNEEIAPAAMVQFTQGYYLKSNISQQKIHVHSNSWMMVYLSDLARWIERNVQGVNFENVQDEIRFLELYPEIQKSQYV